MFGKWSKTGSLAVPPLISQRFAHGFYGQVHIIELPAVPLEACASMDHAFKALKKAQELHQMGLYDEAVAKCRVALEKFFAYEEKQGADGKTTRVPKLAPKWVDKLGENTYNWLNNSLTSLKIAANAAHHSPNAHHNQFESKMLIAITTTVVAYAARTEQQN